MTIPRTKGSHSDSLSPNIAFGGGVYLAAWTTTLDLYSAQRDIVGMRLAPDGTRLSETAIHLVRADDEQLLKGIGFDGANFMLVYTTRLTTSATLVTPAGVVLDPPVIPLASNFSARSMAFDGTNYLIVDYYGRLLRVTPAGNVLQDVPIGGAYAAGVAFDGSQYLVAYRRVISSSAYSLHGRFVTTGGAVGNEFSIIPNAPREENTEFTTAIASNGNGWLVVYQHNSQVYAAPLSATGAAQGGGGDLGLTVQGNARAMYFAGGYYVFSSSTAGVQAVKLGGTGSVLAGPATFPAEFEGAGAVGIANDGSAPIAVFSATRDLAGDVFASRFTQALGADGGNFLLSRFADNQDGPSVAWNGENYLVAYRDYTVDRSDRVDIVATRVAPDRRVLDPNGIVLSNTDVVQYPSVASNGTDWLVVWMEGDIRGARVDRSGNVLAPGAFTVAAHGGTLVYDPRVASDGDGYLVVYTSGAGGPMSTVRAQRVSEEGVPLDGASGFQLSTTAISERPRVAWNGTHYLVAWNGENLANIRARRVTQSGTPVEASDFLIAFDGTYKAVASNGTDWLVAWVDSYAPARARAVRVRDDGVVLDAPGPEITATSRVGELESVWTGTDYLVAWTDTRNGATNPYASTQNWDIYGARVAPNGTVRDPTGFAISSTVEPEQLPGLAAGSGQALAVYSRLDPESPYGMWRVRGRTLGAMPDPDGGAGGDGGATTGGTGTGGGGGSSSGGTAGNSTDGGEGGDSITGGSSTTGGNDATGGSGARGGSGATAGSSAGRSGKRPRDSKDDGGCGCRVTPVPQGARFAWLSLFLLAVIARRRARPATRS